MPGEYTSSGALLIQLGDELLDVGLRLEGGALLPGDEHLYHTTGKAKDVKTAIGAARAEASRKAKSKKS